MKKSVAVVGGGIVGMSTALFLKELFEVTLFERETDPIPLGAGIMMQPSGLHVLNELGVCEEVYRRGTLIEGFVGRNATGRVDFDINFEDHEGGIYGVGVQRGSIYYSLLKRVKESDINFKSGCEINDFTSKSEKINLLTREQQSFDGFDFVIVSNGAKSKLRDKFSNFHFSRLSGSGAIWTKVLPDENSPKNKIYQVYDGTKRMLGLMPIGFESDESRTNKLNFFFGTSLKYLLNWNNVSLLEWKTEVLNVDPSFKQYLDQIKSKENLVCAPYADVWAKKYYQDQFLFIGDAAHAMGPHLSSGTNLGLQDALCLRDLFRKSDDFEIVFQQYQVERESQLKYYQSISRFISPYFQSDLDKSFVRSYILKYLYQLPKVSDIMVQTITGRRRTMFEILPDSVYLSKLQ
jgi:2-polyprenyl-6-methoxyphenol hydroxylase-like FAD-dependent oxidoreductase